MTYHQIKALRGILLDPINGWGWKLEENPNISGDDVVVAISEKCIRFNPEITFAVIFHIYGLNEESIKYCQSIAMQKVDHKINKAASSMYWEHYNKRLAISLSNASKAAEINPGNTPIAHKKSIE